MQYTELPAPPPLDALVRCFWFLRGHDAVGEPQTIVADGRLEIVLHLGEPFARIEPYGPPQRQAHVLVAGQLTGPLGLCATGETDVVGIRFRTAAATALLRPPPGELTDRVESLHDCDPALADALQAAAARAHEPAARVAALARVLERAILRLPDPLAAAAVRTLDRPAAPPVARIAHEHGMSARTLDRRILAATGLPPAVLRRVLRFRRAFRMLDAAGRDGGRIALAAGYYDQAHFIREFRRFAGAPPSAFLRAEPDLARAMAGGDDVPRSR